MLILKLIYNDYANVSQEQQRMSLLHSEMKVIMLCGVDLFSGVLNLYLADIYIKTRYIYIPYIYVYNIRFVHYTIINVHTKSYVSRCKSHYLYQQK